MNISLLCVGLLGVLSVVTGIAVTLARGKYGVLSGNSTEPTNPLHKWVRAQGNTAEYAAVLMILIYVLGQTSQPGWVVWSMILVTFSRYLFVAGIVLPETMAKPNPMRFLGALGTYLFGLALCVALLQSAIA